MEMIHSRSYTHIIKNVYPDAPEVFDTILEEKIIERAKSVTEAAMNSSTLLSTVVRWREDAWKDSPNMKNAEN